MRKSYILAAMTVSMLAGSGHAAITVVGNTTARSCYEAAEYKRTGAGALAVCDEGP